MTAFFFGPGAPPFETKKEPGLLTCDKCKGGFERLILSTEGWFCFRCAPPKSATPKPATVDPWNPHKK